MRTYYPSRLSVAPVGGVDAGTLAAAASLIPGATPLTSILTGITSLFGGGGTDVHGCSSEQKVKPGYGVTPAQAAAAVANDPGIEALWRKCAWRWKVTLPEYVGWRWHEWKGKHGDRDPALVPATYPVPAGFGLLEGFNAEAVTSLPAPVAPSTAIAAPAGYAQPGAPVYAQPVYQPGYYAQPVTQAAAPVYYSQPAAPGYYAAPAPAPAVPTAEQQRQAQLVQWHQQIDQRLVEFHSAQATAAGYYQQAYQQRDAAGAQAWAQYYQSVTASIAQLEQQRIQYAA